MRYRQNIDCSDSDKVVWLSNQIVTAFPQGVTDLKFYILDCGCIYYQRVYRGGGGDLDPQVGIYWDAEHGPREICLLQAEDSKDRVIAEKGFRG